MSEDITPENNSIPPRVTIKVPGQSGEVVETPTATLPSAKKKTARISLDQVTAEPGAAAAAPVSGVGVASKSIRLAPAMTGQVSIAPMPTVGKALGGMLSEEGKRTTSRIPLESVLAEQGGKLPDSAPKTIKVKRPMLSNTPKVAGLAVESQPETPPSTAVASEMQSKSQTARVDIAPEAAEPQQTQKKTIKIRRPDGAGGDSAQAGRSISIARTEGLSAEVSAAGAGVPSPHWFFVVSAAAAAITICFMLYVLAAQAYPDLGWKVAG